MTENALVPLFEGKELRAIEQNGDIWIPLADLASAWGVDRSTPDKMIERNEEVFSGLSALVVDVTSNTPVRCLNERGLYLMMGKISASRLKIREAKNTIIRFQRWFPELIQKYRKKEIVQATPSLDINAELQRAKMLAQGTGGNLQAFQVIALEKCGLGDYAKALQPVALPAIADTSQPGIWMTPTDIGRECGLSAREVNSWLYNHQYQYPEGPVWRLTTLGERFGEEYPFMSPYKHSETRIRWHRSVLVASGLKRPISVDQMALPSTARV